ncbi:hypothetical protein AAHC03_024397 [Spirometra sp. Aus1]
MSEVIAIYKYEKTNEKDLSFEKGERLTILKHTTDENWAIARNQNGEEGLIPLTFVEPEFEPNWLHGQISREEADTLLQGRKPGSFLVRASCRFTGDYTLCVVTRQNGETVGHSEASREDKTDPPEGPVQHYHIHTIIRENGFTPCTFYSLDQIQLFPSLRKLVEFYQVADRGLAHPLTDPVVDQRRKRLNYLRERHWIQRDEVTFGQKLGHGEFGEVLRGTYRNRDVAVKQYKASAKKLLIHEACIMAVLRHRNLVSLVGVTEDPDGTFYLISEYLPVGSLLNYLRSRGRTLITHRDLLSFATDVVQGLVYMEEKGFLHCDVAARNVLLTDAHPLPMAKLGDFGLACHVHSQNAPANTASSPTKGYSGSQPGTTAPAPASSRPTSPSIYTGNPVCVENISRIPIKWTAPESVRTRIFTHKSDVWSFGILLWELYSYGRLPYPRLLTNQVLKFLESGERMGVPEDCPPGIYALMLRTWKEDPAHRPSFAQIQRDLASFYAKSAGSVLAAPRPGRQQSASCSSDDLYESLQDEQQTPQAVKSATWKKPSSTSKS